jgi:predicted AAA+ superfamily ATPase
MGTRKAALDEHDFEGTLVLEKLASIDRVDAFFEAVDADDFARASALMKRAGIDPETIAIVLKRMSDPDGNH